jgi:hypothetical protein
MTPAGIAELFFVRVLSGSPRRVPSGMSLQDNIFLSDPGPDGNPDKKARVRPLETKWQRDPVCVRSALRFSVCVRSVLRVFVGVRSGLEPVKLGRPCKGPVKVDRGISRSARAGSRTHDVKQRRRIIHDCAPHVSVRKRRGIQIVVAALLGAGRCALLGILVSPTMLG